MSDGAVPLSLGASIRLIEESCGARLTDSLAGSLESVALPPNANARSSSTTRLEQTETARRFAGSRLLLALD